MVQVASSKLWIAVAVVLALAVKLAVDWKSGSAAGAPYPTSFSEMSHDVFRLQMVWRTGVSDVSTSVFAVRIKHDWVLLDSGAPADEGGGNILVEALKQLLQPADRLRQVICKRTRVLASLQDLNLENRPSWNGVQETEAKACMI